MQVPKCSGILVRVREKLSVTLGVNVPEYLGAVITSRAIISDRVKNYLGVLFYLFHCFHVSIMANFGLHLKIIFRHNHLRLG